MVNKFRIRRFSLLLLVSIAFTSSLLLTSCTVSRNEELYQIPLTEEQLVELEKMKSPGFISSDEEEFLEFFNQLDKENQEYIIKTVGEENLMDFGVNSHFRINKHLFEPQYIDVLLELADVYAEHLEISNMTTEEYDKMLEQYTTKKIPDTPSTEEEFVAFITAFFEEIGYYPESNYFVDKNRIVLYNSYAWRKSNARSFYFMQSHTLPNNYFKKNSFNEYSITQPLGADKRFFYFSQMWSKPIYVSSDGKYIMYFETTFMPNPESSDIIKTFCTLEL